MTLRNCVKIET